MQNLNNDKERCMYVSKPWTTLKNETSVTQDFKNILIFLELNISTP
jgi:hypothetical protein